MNNAMHLSFQVKSSKKNEFGKAPIYARITINEVTGLETDDRIEIKSGLKNGDVVVVSGAYLLNSEYIFKKGADPMSGMKM